MLLSGLVITPSFASAEQAILNIAAAIHADIVYFIMVVLF
jgi:hypothetical protein